MQGRRLIFAFYLFAVQLSQGRSVAQSPYFTIDTSIKEIFVLPSSFEFWPSIFQTREEIIEKFPGDADKSLLRENRSLIYQKPDKSNPDSYMDIAAALWHAGRIAEAKKMFLTIEQSKEPFYVQNTFHSAGNIYEYGSYTSNYKNEACFYLVKIFIQERKYSVALDYLMRADKKYKIQYNCGTGDIQYMNDLKNYYAACYSGLGRIDEVIGLHLSETFYGDYMLAEILKNKYNPSEIDRQLDLAIDNITVIKDDHPSTVYMRDKNGKDSLIATYFSGKASSILFGRKIELPSPRLNDGEMISRSKVIKEFKESGFYKDLYSSRKDGGAQRSR